MTDIYGTNGKDYISTTSGNDYVYAKDGRDVIKGSTGNDVIDGGSGYNQVDYAGNIADYTFTLNSDDSIRVEKPGGYIDTLHNIGGIWFEGEAEWRSIEDLTGTGNSAPIAVDDQADITVGEKTEIDVLGNDSDPDGDEFAVHAINGVEMRPGWTTWVDGVGLVTVNANGTLSVESFTEGPYSFEYTICDDKGALSTATISGNATTGGSANTPPVAIDDWVDAPVGQPTVVNVLDNDSDPEGDTLTITEINGVAMQAGWITWVEGVGLVTVNGDGTLSVETFQPGDFSFDYTISDGNGGTSTATVEGGTGTQNTTDAVDDAAWTNAGQAVTIDVLDNDSDPEGDTFSVTSFENGANGTVSQGPNGQLIYTPNAGFSGTDTFTYTITDANGATDTATVNVDVQVANSTDAVDDAAWTNAGQAVTIDVLDNDSDPEGDTFSVSGFTNGENGTVSRGPNGQLIYTPNAGFTGSDWFTYTITDANGATDTATVDVDVQPPVANSSIGNRVFLDANGNGIQDAGETGAANVTVNLKDASGAIIATQQTDANGNYLFDNLTAGDYSVGVVAPEDFDLTTQDAGSDDAADSDINVTTGMSDTITLGENEQNLTVDAGLVNTPPPTDSSIGNRVFLDTNRNGIQDAGEAGVADVTVNLKDASGAVIATQQTDANGNYLFDELAAGDYSVGVVAPDNFTVTQQDAGSDDATDSDINVTTGMSDTVTLGENEQNLTVDAGLIKTGTASIGDRIFIDSNRNGVQDGGEAGAKGVTVNLKDANGTIIATQQTDANGNYLFDELAAGQYSVGIETPNSYKITKQDVGNNAATDSDFNVDTGMTDIINLKDGQAIDSVDGGLLIKGSASIGDRVFLDANRNGIQDAGETGVAGVTVNLKNANGEVIETQQTDANGNYLFDEITVGRYAVGIETPEGYVITQQDAGTDNTIDSDVNVDTGMTSQFNLKGGQAITSVDAGLYRKGSASIGDRVFLDANRNGIQDAGETGVAGVTVNLKNADGDVIETQQTDANGNYLFDELTVGRYAVGIETPDGFAITQQDAGTDNTADSDINVDTGMTSQFGLNGGQAITSVDAGLFQLGTASLGDRVFLDGNRNGLQDAGEAGVAGVTVNLKNADGDVIDTQQTDANGNYLFDQLAGGQYILGVETPNGFKLTEQDAGNNNFGTDSDFNVDTGMTDIINLADGQAIDSADAGLLDTSTDLKADTAKVCEDEAETFNVLTNDAGNNLRLVGVTHETPELQAEFEARGGELSFDANGNVTYTGMTDYYGNDVLIYTVEDEFGGQFTQRVDVEVEAASDGPQVDVTEDFQRGVSGYHHDKSYQTHITHHSSSERYVPVNFFEPFINDDKDGLQQFSDYNVGVADDTDNIAFIEIFDAEDNGTIWRKSGEVVDPVDGVVRIPWHSIILGGLTVDLPGPWTEHTFSFRAIDTGGNVSGQKGTNVSNSDFITAWTPVALDLNGDGKIGVTGETSSHEKDADAEIGETVQFDIDADGDLDTIEWFDGSGDGILVDMSKIGADGSIDGSALFGDEGGQYANGYDKLAAFDANGDGQVSGEELNTIGVWIDDGDAILEEGELVTAEEQGIASVSTEMEIVLDSDGKELMQSTATTTDGETILSEDVWFTEDTADVTGETILPEIEVCEEYEDCFA